MTTIRTTCLSCGTVDLTVNQIILEPERYRFDCPECGKTRSHPASQRMVDVLLVAGVEYDNPITEDEIAVFVMELDMGITDEAL